MKLTLTSQPRLFSLKCKQGNKTPGKTFCISNKILLHLDYK